MNIISIDASTKSTGIAIYNHNQLTYYTCLTASSADLFRRIQKITNEIKDIISQNLDLDYLILQQVRPDNGFSNIKTHKALMYLQGNIAMMLYTYFKHMQIDYLYPSEWRKVCGIKQGRGVQRSTLKQSDINFVKQHFNIQVNDDIADAICIGYAYINK